MIDKLKILNTDIIYEEKDKELFDDFLNELGVDKSYEILTNYQRVSEEKKVDLNMLLAFLGYEYALSSILYTILRGQEDSVKAFLCNTFHGYPVSIEKRPSNYSKTKYYFKIPVKNGKYLDIRTFNYTEGPVDYYDAVKTMDFGDVNLIMSHLDKNVLLKFSNNPNIINELDQTRKIRNYVYHHNLLYSFDKEDLEYGIAFIIKNLPFPELKKDYIDEINNLRYEGAIRDFDIGEKIAIYLNDDLQKLIFQKR